LGFLLPGKFNHDYTIAVVHHNSFFFALKEVYTSESLEAVAKTIRLSF
jgi:hypothetical protein